MKKSLLKKIREILLEQKQQLLTTPKFDNEVDTDGDETDEIQGHALIEILNRLNSRNHTKLEQIEGALKRIDDKTYGVCEDCDEDIPEKRLLANPHCLICVPCAEDREKEEKRGRA
jgi:DnaK suppressor protein